MKTPDIETLKRWKDSTNWAGVLLFAALLAQAPHAAWVFLRVAPHDAGWEIAIALVGAVVYAIALEGATAYFVWQDARRIAAAFAVFSFLHNVAYYMPELWGFELWGATLTARFILSMLLISASLPIAIAAFSHVQAERRNVQETAKPVQEIAEPVRETAKPVREIAEPAKPTPQLRRAAIVAHLSNGWNGAKPAAEIVDAIVEEFATNPSTVYRDLQSLQDAKTVHKDANGVIHLKGIA